MKHLLIALFALASLSLNAQRVEWEVSDTLTNVQSDTTQFSFIVPYHGVMVYEHKPTVISGAPTASVQFQGSINGDVWYDLYAAPEGTGVPTLTPIAVTANDVLFLPKRGFESFSVERPFRYLRIITAQAGTAEAYYHHWIMLAYSE